MGWNHTRRANDSYYTFDLHELHVETDTFKHKITLSKLRFEPSV